MRASIRMAAFAAATVSGTALALSPGAASAQSAFDWSGFHAGGFASANWAELRTDGNTGAISTTSDTAFLAGVSGGYRFAFSNDLVLNLQIEIPLTQNTGSADDTVFFPAPAFVPPVTYEYEVNWAGFVTGQLGMAFDRFLPYVEVGAGPARVTYRVFNVAGAGTYSPGAVQKASNTHFVWKIGVGLDYAFTDHLIGGVNVNYLRADKKSYDVPWNAPGPNFMGADAFAIGAHLSYKF